MLVYILAALMVSTANASSDQWFCKEGASQKRLNVITSCGIGTGDNEDEARGQAFESALAEFDRVCTTSSDCIYHEVITIPKRTDCSHKNNQFICYRAVDFTIGEAKNINGRPVKASGKIKQGMTVKQVIAAFGRPDRTNTFDLDPSIKKLAYDNKDFCEQSNGFCVVDIQNGKVINHWYFKTEFVADFE